MIDSTTPSTLYVGTYGGGVFKSTDSGGTWTTGIPGLANMSISSLAIDPTNHSTLYAGALRGGAFKSTDAGITWAPSGTGLPNAITALAINPTSSMLYAATYFGGGVFKSTDSGGNWAPANSGLTTLSVEALAISPLANTLFAATYLGGVHRSTDAGLSWTPANTGLTDLYPSAEVVSLAIDPVTPTTLYAGTFPHSSIPLVLKSTDSGGTWGNAGTGLSTTLVAAMVIDPTIPSTLYASTFDHGVYKSTDAGSTWNPANTGMGNVGVSSLAIDPTAPATIYAATGSGVFKSTDSGASWVPPQMGPPIVGVYSLAIDPTATTTLYAGWNIDGVFKSTDGGGTWSAASAGLTNLNVVRLAINSSVPSMLFAATYDGGIFKSTDAGGSWTAFNTGLPSLSTHALALDSRGSTTLYVGLEFRGVWQLTPCATSVVSGTATICAGGSTPIQASLTGTGPWNVTWSDSVVQSGVAVSPATRNVSPSSTTTYTVTALTDANCAAQVDDMTGSAVVTVNPVPSRPVITAPASALAGTTGLIASVSLHTDSSYSWAITNGTITAGATTNQITFTAGVSGVTVLTVVETTIGTGCASATATTNVTIGAEPAGLVEDAHASSGTISNVNHILEPGETVFVNPSWKNINASPLALTGTASAFAGPAGATYTLINSSAGYGTIAPGAAADSFSAGGPSYLLSVDNPVTRPAAHWDATFFETLSNGITKTWTLHVGQSFSDVPVVDVSYPFVENILHNGITMGCGGGNYCPNSDVTRWQMAIFLARSMVGPNGTVPTSGTVPGVGSYNCSLDGNSLFGDVPPSDGGCSFIHYIYANGITSGCGGGNYCPASIVTRWQMAVFLAKGMVGPSGIVPASGTVPSVGSYNCSPGGNSLFGDVPPTDAGCRFIHYLYANGVTAGCGGGNYCPTSNVNRWEMAVFLVTAFKIAFLY